MFRKLLDQAEAGDNIGALFVVFREEIQRGQVLAKPGSVKPQQNSKLRGLRII